MNHIYTLEQIKDMIDVIELELDIMEYVKDMYEHSFAEDMTFEEFLQEPMDVLIDEDNEYILVGAGEWHDDAIEKIAQVDIDGVNVY
ncbi:MAG: hypothetical protein HXO06_00670 [Prevotella salivae]|uniref:hypothetical protein n=1 Tax=Segatella salivae TaxID=228604 RepID=UPI001CAD84D0|nr:hypothetical protein [Segatella salivae]MBF1543690.1 hypothetical protein [Segatella salivae]